MATYIARSASDKLLVARDNSDGSISQEMLGLLRGGFTLYRVSPVGDGTFLLTPQEVAPGSETTEVVITDATLQDAV